MNKAHGITKENLLASLPAVLANDDNMAALAAAVAEVLADRVGEIGRVSIYSQIDQLPNELLDILAYDFKVDWWNGDLTLDEKRRTLKNALSVHRTKGTKHAVQAAISAIYEDATISEWFEYGGTPGRFRIEVDNLFRFKVFGRWLSLAVEQVKRASAHLDGVYVVKRPEQHLCHAVTSRTNLRLHADTDGSEVVDMEWLADGAGIPLADENGNILIL